MKQEHSNAFMATEPLGRLMRKFAIPCIISLVVASLYNIVDQIFIANADYLGSFGNAASTVVYPLMVIIVAIASMIGDGCCAFVSISLGAKKPQRASRSIGSSIVLAVISGIVMTVIFIFFDDRLIAMFGGTVNEETFAMSKEYFRVLIIGVPFYMFGQAMNAVIRADGSPAFAMVSTLAGAVINIILDPVFIFGFKWGMTGAAAATILGQAVTAILAIFYLFNMKIIKLDRSCFKPSSEIIGKFIPLGICSFLAQASVVTAIAAINSMIQKYGAVDEIFSQAQYAQIPLAVIGIISKVFQIAISITIGMGIGCIPIVGFNIGAGRNDRAKGLFIRLLIAEACVGVVFTLIALLFPAQLFAIFGSANESIYYTQFGVRALRIYLSMLILACLNKAAFIFMQSLGRPWVSTILSIIREVLFGVGFALLLPRFMGLDGVLYSVPVADVLMFVITIFVIIRTYRQLSLSTFPQAPVNASTYSL